MLIKADMFAASGGGTPEVIKYGYIEHDNSIIQTIDTSKKYIVAVSGNYSNYTTDLLDTYKVESGIVTDFNTSSSLSTNVSVSGTTLTISNPSGTIAISYSIIELN